MNVPLVLPRSSRKESASTVTMAACSAETAGYGSGMSLSGRRPDNDVALPAASVSAEHAAVVTVLDDSFLEDLGSTNGTFVNDRPVTKHFLRDRDRLDIGREILVYYSDDNAESEPLPPELLEHDRGSILEPLDAHLSALSDMAKSRSMRGRGTEPRPVVAEFDPTSTSPMTGQIATELDSMTGDGDGPDPESERTRPVAARVDDTAPRPKVAHEADTPSAPGEAPAPDPVPLLVRVLDGPSAGREIDLSKPEMLFGRVGLQVAALYRTDNRVRLVPVEGAVPPSRNGAPVPAEGVDLQPGDMFEVAGTTLSLVVR